MENNKYENCTLEEKVKAVVEIMMNVINYHSHESGYDTRAYIELEEIFMSL